MFYALSWAAEKQVPTNRTSAEESPREDEGEEACSLEESHEARLPEHYDRAKVRRLLMYLVLIPAVVSFVLGLVGTYASKDYVPLSLDVHLWRNFSVHVKRTVHALDTKYPHNVLIVLFVVHAIQVLLCFPLMHVTKIMYGYFFGPWVGGGISSAWELFLVSVFLLVATQNVPIRPPSHELAGFLQYVASLRAKKMLFLVCMHMSSVPLVTATCLVLFQVVSRVDFLLSHVCATALMTFKDTWLGHFLASSDGNASNIAVAATLLSASALLPTVLTVSLMGCVSSAVISNTASGKSPRSATCNL